MAHGDHVAVILEHVDGVFDGLLVKVPRSGHFEIGETQDAAAHPVHPRLGRKARSRARLVKGSEKYFVLE